MSETNMIRLHLVCGHCRCIMPIGAGFVVAYLQGWGFSPALKFLTRAIEGVVDDTKNAALPTSYWQVHAGCVIWCTAAAAAYLQQQQQQQQLVVDA
jgi:hypothetical protein